MDGWVDGWKVVERNSHHSVGKETVLLIALYMDVIAVAMMQLLWRLYNYCLLNMENIVAKWYDCYDYLLTVVEI